MITEIITIGKELILGEVVDTNSVYIANFLSDLGYDINYITTVGENKKGLLEVFKQALKRSDLIITTGGLAYNSLTQQVIAETTNCPLQKYNILQNNSSFFKDEDLDKFNNKNEAYFPQGSAIIKNNYGTIPGFELKTEDNIILSFPAVTKEMKKMLINTRPFLIYLNKSTIQSKILNFFSIEQSTLERKLKDLFEKQSNPSLTLLPGKGEVKLRIIAKDSYKEKAELLIAKTENRIRKLVGEYLYGYGNDDLSTVLGQLLKDNDYTLAIAESCTGGLIADRITDFPGCSRYFIAGLVTYSNQSKIDLLGVKKETILKHGAVSKQTVKEMAEGVKSKLNTDFGIAVSGIAGPDGGSKEKPLGLIYLAIASNDEVKTYKLNLNGDRVWNKWMTSQYALYYLYKYINNIVNYPLKA